MGDIESGGHVELRDYLLVLRRRFGTIAQATIAFALVAAAVSFLQPKVYESEARILVSRDNPGAVAAGGTQAQASIQPERELQTQVQLMQLRPLASETVKKLELRMTPDELLEKIKVQPIEQTDLLRIVARDGDPRQAAAIANGMANAYVEWAASSRRGSLKAAIEQVTRRQAATHKQVLKVSREIRESGETDELTAERDIAMETYTTLGEKLEQLRIDSGLEQGPASVVSPAWPKTDPAAPQPVLNIGLGVVFGLLTGIGIAFVAEYLDNTVKTASDAESLLPAPVLGEVPLERLDRGETWRLTMSRSPGSGAAEAYRVIRSSLGYLNFEGDLRTLVVTSSSPGEGKSTVAANLALSLAQAGYKTTLVSCDFRRPATEGLFRVSGMIGLSDVLSGAHSLKTALQRPGDEPLYVLTAGKLPPNPAELLGSVKMNELIDSLKSWTDWIVIDTPPLLSVSDTLAISRWADGVLMIVRAGKSTREDVRKGAELLGQVGARIVGQVVWGAEEDRGGAEGYYAASLDRPRMTAVESAVEAAER